MKKLIMSLALLAACRSSTTTTVSSAPAPVLSGSQTGAANPEAAVRGFLAAAKRTDLQAIGSLWGDREGPARDRFPRDELEKRELIMARCLRHDSYDIAADAPTLGGNHAMVVQLKIGELTRSSSFQVVSGPSDRWYVKEFDMAKLQDICIRRS